MSFLFWGFAVAMLLAAVAFIAVPLKTGKSLFATPGALIIAFVPLSAVALYALLGSPDQLAAPHAAASTAMSAGAAGSAGASDERPLGSVASMVDGLLERLEDNPEDADGWILLARSYQFINRPADALTAYKHAQALGKSDANLEATLLGSGLAEQMSGQTPAQPAGPSLRGRVALAPAAAALVQPGDTLFIFAKQSRADRMPVVALRKSVADLPLDFVLTDKEMMAPGGHLGDFEQLIVTAKISRTGNASDSGLGLEAWSEPVSPASTDRIDLVIGVANE
jgi:cytochrome c-type biogenesis protein CcmH